MLEPGERAEDEIEKEELAAVEEGCNERIFLGLGLHFKEAWRG
jgi:hypothetical protein